VIKPLLRSTCFMVVLAASATSVADPSPIAAPHLHLRWDTGQPRDGIQAICGEVSNDGTLAAQNVLLRIEELDDRGRVINRREIETARSITAQDHLDIAPVDRAAGEDLQDQQIFGAAGPQQDARRELEQGTARDDVRLERERGQGRVDADVVRGLQRRPACSFAQPGEDPLHLDQTRSIDQRLQEHR
jgi:hypothetical protein